MADGAEDVEIERVFESDGHVRNVGRDAQHLAGGDHYGLAFEMKFERALQNVGDLFTLMVMLRHHSALGQEDLRDHGLIAGDDLAPDGGAENLFFHFVPGVMFHVPAIV